MHRTLKKIRILKVILGTVIGVAVFMVLGTMGSLELDYITIGAALQATMVYGGIGFLAGYALKWLEIREQEILDIMIARRRERRRLQEQKEENWRRYFRETTI